ncbi:hypothetical protein SNE510_25800 [Streptomyces sp. NE5-10]|uniref:hypothetical protein n=1 Tax=Streptomyces sp. NE5-10 TaxID=2759674 RepID=UPI0019084E46|nr:hypothetical protein [Streptomyces sp. NE5-10]GHJ93061.1 hypothetical protein SNE510_25800 [Streptomyces sp. NE5-10]
MALLPEDIIDRLIQMERRINALSTAVNTRPPLTEITNGSLALKRQPAPEDPSALVAQFSTSGPGGNKPVLRVNDAYGHEVLSDDILTGGLARPWLPMLPPQDLASVNWPATTATAWTTVAQSQNPIWQPKMRLRMLTRVSSGATGQIRVMVGGAQFGPTVAAGAVFDHTAAVTADMQADFGKDLTVEVQAIVTSASGTVYAKPVLMHGRQT